MKKPHLYQSIIFAVASLFASATFAWDHSVTVGYGYSHDPNHSRYNNSGFLLSGALYTFYQSYWTHWSLYGALGHWHTTTPVNQNLNTAAVDLELRLYGFEFGNAYSSYLFGSAGPAYLSNRFFGYNEQGSHLAIQSNLGFGVEFHPVDVNLRLEHFSNAGLANPNQGFNILYLLSVGYLF